jgi:hypothetical protein
VIFLLGADNEKRRVTERVLKLVVQNRWQALNVLLDVSCSNYEKRCS